MAEIIPEPRIIDCDPSNDTWYTRIERGFELIDFRWLLESEETIMRFRFVAGLFILAVMSVVVVRPAQAVEDQAQEVKAALGQFHDALNLLFTGDAAPMKAVWSHADDATYMGPYGGTQVGWSQVEAYWDKQAAKKLGGKVDPQDVHIVASPTLAVVHYHEKGEHVVGGKSQNVDIRATTTFRKERDVWKVIGHHTDTMASPQK